MKEFKITKNDSGQRLNKFMEKAVPLLPPSLMHKYIRKKRIKINNKLTSFSYKLEEGDVLSLYINDEFFEKVDDDTAYTLVTPNISVVYEDENILLVHKKIGMLCHSDDSNDINTLITHVKAYLYKNGDFNPEDSASFEPALCNRIDRNTGGIVISAKTAEALRVLNQKIRDHEIVKKYICAVHDEISPKKGKFDGFILKNAKENRVTVHKNQIKGSKTALTYYTVLEQKKHSALVECMLVTGRTHQIRAHFANAGHPLVGDTKYGLNKNNQNFSSKFQCLYSYKLKFDFTTDSGSLSYLNGKEFAIDTIDFAEKFHNSPDGVF